MNRDKNIHILLLASNNFKTNNFLHTEALEKKNTFMALHVYFYYKI